MSITIDVPFVTAFNDSVYQVKQQMESRLRGAVRIKPVTGEACTFERLGKTTFVEKTGRHTPTPQADVVHTRRWARMVTRNQGETIDNDDEASLLVTPKSDYITSLVAAGNRDFDQQIVNAMRGNAEEGHNGGTQTALPAGQKIVHGSAGLTTAKVIQARTLLAPFAQNSAEELFIVVGAQQFQDIITESNAARITSGDYNQARPLMAGKILWWLGFNWIEIDDSILPLATYRYCYAWNKKAVGVGIAKDLTPNVGQDAGMSFATRIMLEHKLGAVRIEDESVVEIECVVP